MLLSMVLVLLLSLVLSRVVRSSVSEVLRRRGLPQEGRWRVISRLLHYTILSIGIASASRRLASPSRSRSWTYTWPRRPRAERFKAAGAGDG